MSVFQPRSPTPGGMMYAAGPKGATVIKARLGADIRRIPIINEELTYDDLILMMERIFKLNDTDQILVKYTDDDGDLVTILDNGDLSHAKTYGSVLRLTLYVNGAGHMMTQTAQLQSQLGDLSKAVTALTSKLEQMTQIEPAVAPPTAVDADDAEEAAAAPSADGTATDADGEAAAAAPAAATLKFTTLEDLASSPSKLEPTPEPSHAKAEEAAATATAEHPAAVPEAAATAPDQPPPAAHHAAVPPEHHAVPEAYAQYGMPQQPQLQGQGQPPHGAAGAEYAAQPQPSGAPDEYHSQGQSQGADDYKQQQQQMQTGTYSGGGQYQQYGQYGSPAYDPQGSASYSHEAAAGGGGAEDTSGAPGAGPPAYPADQYYSHEGGAPTSEAAYYRPQAQAQPPVEGQQEYYSQYAAPQQGGDGGYYPAQGYTAEYQQ